jgi:L-lysine 6-transaminase
VDAATGKEYLDFYTYFASLPLGHNHPAMLEPEFHEKLLRAAVANPANSDVYTVEYAEFVAALRRTAQRDYLNHAFFVAGGALGVENALKAAFDWKTRKNMAAGRSTEFGLQVLHFRNAFHGRTGYTLSLTNTADPRKTMYFPKFDWPRIENPYCRFPLEGENLAAVKEAECRAVGQIQTALAKYGHGVAALIVEPIQGEGGDNHFRGEFLRELRRLADEHEFILIHDEVQTGVGLTGAFWAHEHFGAGARPDAVAFGKKMQICGFLGGPRFDEVEKNVFRESSRINSTWGGNLVDMVRGQRVLEVIESENLVDNAAERGTTLLGALNELEKRQPRVVQTRGRGLMAAFDVADGKTRDEVLAAARERGLLALGCGTRSVRFRPALTVTDAEILRGVDILEDCIRTLS